MLICALMLIVCFIQKTNPMLFFLAGIPSNCGAIERDGFAGTQNEFIPRLALPFGKRTFIAYMQIRTIIFYCIIGFLAISVMVSLHFFFPRISVTWQMIPFLVLFCTILQSGLLIVNCLTSMRKGILVPIIIMLFTMPASGPFAAEIANASNEGIFIPMKAMNALTNGFFQWSLGFPAQSLLIALAIAVASGIFALAWAKRIRF